MNLNEQQKLAVETISGPLLILAGAGTGKTKTLVSRIAYLVQNGYASPNQIIAVTFTNKAANEMINRVKDILGYAEFSWVGTFHSIAAKILRANAEKIGLKSDFIIIDTDDQDKIIKKVAKDLNVELDKTLLSKYSNVIASWKDKALTPARVRTSGMVKSWADEQILKVYELYQKKLIESNATDFGDLLMHNITIFNNNTDVLDHYRTRFNYLMVDEYQDTNICQYLWLRLLAQKHKNICCVGDDDQSIYGWRGAEVGNILRFSEDFVGAKIIKLEQNYRSTSKILNAAHKVISNNGQRLGKKLWTKDDEGEEIKILTCIDGEEEARMIISAARRNIGKYKLNDTAILVRASFQTRAFEEACMKSQTPYKVIGGPKFYDRKEVKDVIAYLRLVVNDRDNLAFERIINSPKRGIGLATLDKIYNFSLEVGTSMLAAASALAESGEVKNKNLTIFIGNVRKWQQELQSTTLHNVLKNIAIGSGYIEMLKKNDEEARIENIAEIFRVIEQFGNAVDFLEHVSLVTDNTKENTQDAINIMTLHSSKGLEFDQVFLPGWEDGVFPHLRSLSSETQIEEERRLAYVGITRAKKSLTISSARRRFIRNCWQNTSRSRFLLELVKH